MFDKEIEKKIEKIRRETEPGCELGCQNQDQHLNDSGINRDVFINSVVIDNEYTMSITSLFSIL